LARKEGRDSPALTDSGGGKVRDSGTFRLFQNRRGAGPALAGRDRRGTILGDGLLPDESPKIAWNRKRVRSAISVGDERGSVSLDGGLTKRKKGGCGRGKCAKRSGVGPGLWGVRLATKRRRIRGGASSLLVTCSQKGRKAKRLSVCERRKAGVRWLSALVPSGCRRGEEIFGVSCIWGEAEQQQGDVTRGEAYADGGGRRTILSSSHALRGSGGGKPDVGGS